MALSPFFSGSSVWDPFSSLLDPFDGLILLEHGPRPSLAKDASAIASTKVDWLETPEAHIFKADLPGLKKEHIQLEVEAGNVLKISGTRSPEDVNDTDKWHRVERSYGQFLRRFQLPENVHLDKVAANVENGVLSVTVPKVAEKKVEARSVDIKWGDL